MSTIKNVLIIGGTGITSTDVSRISSTKKDINLHLLNRGKTHQFLESTAKINYIKMNINSPASVLKNKLKNQYFDVICDFISYTPDELLHKLDIFRGKYEQYIFISSCSVYRDNYITTDLKEENTTPKGNLLWTYGWNKFLCEEALKQYSNTNKTKYTIIRPSVTCDDRYFLNGWTLNKFDSWTIANRLLNYRPLLMPDGGNQICSVMHSIDFANGLVQLFGNAKAFNETINITGDEYKSYKEIAQIQASCLGVKAQFLDIPAEHLYFFNPQIYNNGLLGKIMAKSFNTKYDNSKLKKILPDFKQDIQIKEMTERVISFYEQNPNYKRINHSFDRLFDDIINSNSSYHLNLENYSHVFYMNRLKDFSNKSRLIVPKILNKIIRK